MSQAVTVHAPRITFIDIIRGILIILVVIGHLSIAHGEYIYWFHIPSFFMLSGSLYNQKELHHLYDYFKKNIRMLLIPYFYNFVLITIVGFVLGLLQIGDIPDLISDFLRGGTYLTSIFGVFWFISTFVISRMIFAITQATLPKYIKWPLYIGMYFLSHALANLPPSSGVALNDYWWAPRYFLLGVPYLALGYLLREKIIHFTLNIPKFTITSLVYSILIYLDLTHRFLYRFDWKYGIHNSVVLDLIIPCIGFYLVLSIGRLVLKSPFASAMARIGRETMHIMYWHLVILTRIGI